MIRRIAAFKRSPGAAVPYEAAAPASAWWALTMRPTRSRPDRTRTSPWTAILVPFLRSPIRCTRATEGHGSECARPIPV
jgi:hypothetical protein